jgi:hypothetical protein
MKTALVAIALASGSLLTGCVGTPPASATHVVVQEADVGPIGDLSGANPTPCRIYMKKCLPGPVLQLPE